MKVTSFGVFQLFTIVGGWTNPSEKNMLVKFDHLPRDRGKHKKSLKPAPTSHSLIWKPWTLNYSWLERCKVSGLSMKMQLFHGCQFSHLRRCAPKIAKKTPFSKKISNQKSGAYLTHRIHVWNIYLYKFTTKNQPNVGKYTIHEFYGSGIPNFFKVFP